MVPEVPLSEAQKSAPPSEEDGALCFVSVQVLELVGGEQSAVTVCEVDGDEWCEVCGDVAVQVGAGDADTITEGEGHQSMCDRQSGHVTCESAGTLVCGRETGGGISSAVGVHVFRRPTRPLRSRSPRASLRG